MGNTSVKYQVAKAVNHSYLLHLFINHDVLGQKTSVLKFEKVKAKRVILPTVTTRKTKADIQKYSPTHVMIIKLQTLK